MKTNVLAFGTLMMALTAGYGDEIFFDLATSFNAKILADASDLTSGRGFGGKLNSKVIEPGSNADGTVKSFHFVEYQLGNFAKDNAILLPLGESLRVELGGQPQLTMLAFLYTGFRYEESGSGAGTVTVHYADGTDQAFVWEDPGKSGSQTPNFSVTDVGVGTFYQVYVASEARRAGNLRLHSRVLWGLDPTRVVVGVTFDTKGFVDPGTNAEWGIFAITGDGKLKEPGPLATVNPGTRPYELVNAGRDKDEYPAFVDFRDVSDWTAKADGAETVFASTTQKPLFLPKSARLAIRADTAGVVQVRPPEPLPLPENFNAMTLWAHADGMNSMVQFSPARKLLVTAVFRSAANRLVRVPFISMRHGEWFQLHHQFSERELKELRGGGVFVGLDVSDYGAGENRLIYFSNFAIFEDPFDELTFKEQPKRGIDGLPGATAGVNTGEGRLPFPNREQTILPLNFSENFSNSTKLVDFSDAEAEADAAPTPEYFFEYRGDDATITYHYRPETGTFEDIVGVVRYPDGTEVDFVPMVGGGVRFGDDHTVAASARLVSSQVENDVVVAQWEMTVGKDKVAVTFRLRIWQKSLVIDVLCEGGSVSKVQYGRTTGLESPKLVLTPYYTYNNYSKDRPAVVVAGEKDRPFFLSINPDWYLSNGSVLYALNSVNSTGTTSNGGIDYLPMTNGIRQNCAERIFLTVSPSYEEVLPSIPNPVSPYREIGYSAMWRAAGSMQSRYEQGRFHYRTWRQGITKQNLTDHEVFFRDHEESFTFRTDGAPLKGGDEGGKWISEYLRNELGFNYGTYSQFTDIGTTNAYFRIDRVIRTPENQLQHGWYRMYNAKPVWGTEVADEIAETLKSKFGFTNSYCDVHTAIAPWQFVDYDYRVPGAATFAQTYYSYGQMFLGQKAAWNGPVYSEGNYHAYYAGLTDGDYAQDKGYRLAFNPWLVNFDLRTMHNLNANYGMGDMYMFMWESGYNFLESKAAGSVAVDRLIAATLAYGHAPIMPASAQLQIAGPRTHYMAVPITALYGMSAVESIAYLSADGGWQEVSQAIIDGSYRESQVLVRYENGTTVLANGAPTDSELVVDVDAVRITLPQNGYSAWSKDGSTRVIHTVDEYSQPYDYAVTPEHIYIDGRGKNVRRELAAANGPAVLRILGEGEFEYIPFDREFVEEYGQVGERVMAGFALTVDSVEALDYDLKPVEGDVQVIVSRGLSWVMPVDGAYSYRIKGSLGSPASGSGLESPSPVVFPGQTVEIKNHAGESWELALPRFAEVNRQIWRQFGDEWLDFAIMEPFEIAAKIDEVRLTVSVKSRLDKPVDAVVSVGGEERNIPLPAWGEGVVHSTLPTEVGSTELALAAEADGVSTTRSVTLTAVEGNEVFLTLTQVGVDFGVGLRSDGTATAAATGAEISAQNALGAVETVDVGGSGAMMIPLTGKCGGVSKGALGLQVPFKGGSGYVYLDYPKLSLPAEREVVLRTAFGKRDGSPLGDGMQYLVILTDPAGKEHELGNLWVKKHEWVEFSADLSPWAGDSVGLKFICDSGPDTEGDWGAIAYPTISDVNPTLQYELR